MRVEAARYIGQDNRGQKFEIRANRAIQRSSDVPIVDISGHVRPARPGAGPGHARAPTRAATTSTRRRSRSTGRCGSSGPTAIGSRRATSRSTSSSASCQQRRPVAGQMRLGHVPGGPAAGRPRRAHGRARRRRSLENRAGGGQMMSMRALGIILAIALLRASPAPRPCASRRQPCLGAEGPQQQCAGRRRPPTGSRSRTAPTARSSPATSMSARPS